jgi:ATP-dependent helicase/nuclease subunit B
MDRLLAIYPTARKVEELLKQQSREGCRLGHRVMSFPQLVDGLWRECGRTRTLISRIGERMAVEEAVAKNAAALGATLPVPGGLTAHVLDVIHQLKSAALRPDDLRQSDASGLPGDGLARVTALTEVFATYEALLDARGLADAHDRERIVLGALNEMEAENRRPRFLDGVEQLLVAEIYDFSLLQFMIVAALIRLIGDARLTIQAEPHAVDAIRFPQLTWNRFVEEESIADKVLPDFVRRGGRPGQLGFVLQYLFVEDPPAPPPADETVSIIEAPTRYREVEEVARAIRRMLERPASDRTAPGRIAIVARDPGPYSEYLQTIFRRYRIPLCLRHRPALRVAPAARLALDMLKAPLEDYRRETLKRLLAAAGQSAAGRLLADCGYIDRKTASLADCIARRRREISAELAASAAASERHRRLSGTLASIERTASILDRMIDALKPLETSATAAGHVQRLGEAFQRLGLEPLGDSLASASAFGYGAFRTLLDELARGAELAAPGRLLSLEEFAAMAEAALSAAVLEDPGGDASAGVQALPVLEARGLDFDLVFVLGLNDGTFPLYHADDPILPDGIKAALNRPLAAALRRRFGPYAPRALNKILRTRYDRNSEDAFLFFLALSMPERAIVLSYAVADEDGNPLRRSPFVDEVLGLLAQSAESGSALHRVAPNDFIPAPGDCFAPGEFINYAAAHSMLDRGWARAIVREDLARSIAIRTEIEKRRERYLELPAREESKDGTPDPGKAALAGPYDGRVAADERLGRMLLGAPDSPRRWSAQQLSEFAACGFKFFARRVLGLREEEEPDYEYAASETGELVHDVLRELLSAPIDFSDRARALADARKLLDSMRAQRRATARDPAFFDITWRGIERIIGEVVEFEVRRRTESARALPEFKLEHPFVFTLRGRRDLPAAGRIDIALQGRIDRLEIYRNASGLIEKMGVLDYKTSRRAGDFAKLADPDKNFGTTDFQLPLYAMGALAEFTGKLADKIAIDAGYIVLRSRDKEQSAAIPRDLVEIDPVRRQALAANDTPSKAERVIELASAAVSGHFDVDPLDCDDFCPFRHICRYYKPGVQ